MIVFKSPLTSFEARQKAIMSILPILLSSNMVTIDLISKFLKFLIKFYYLGYNNVYSTKVVI